MTVRNVSIEITNNCNNQCLICPHGHNLIKNKGYMEEDLFRLIIDKLEHLKKMITLELYGIGEPTLHPQLADFISFCAEKGFFTSLCTNAILLNKKNAKALSNSGLKRIVVSLETKENYERIRCSNIYENIVENVISVTDNLPKIELEIFMISIGNEGKEGFKRFKEQFGDRNILFSEFGASDWCGKIPFEGLAAKKGRFVRKVVCPLFESYCSINYEGLIRHCYLDFNSDHVYGDLRGSNFDSIWNSKKRQAVIEKMKAGYYKELSPCSECVFPFVEKESEASASPVTDDELKRPEMQLLSKIKEEDF
ncbi:MAG: radical SAM protein [Candidatus Omnitrophica bacterium]|nr:radical SAM protein [Candidatus Omnitrophota bacterium]